MKGLSRGVFVFLFLLVVFITGTICFFVFKDFNLYGGEFEKDEVLLKGQFLPYVDTVNAYETLEVESYVSKSGLVDLGEFSEEVLLVGNKVYSLNGSVLSFFESSGMIKLVGKNSYVKYHNNSLILVNGSQKKEFPMKVTLHHELEVSNDLKKAYFYTRSVPKNANGSDVLYKGRIVSFDSLIEYNFEKDTYRKWSMWENFDEIKRTHPDMELDSDDKLSSKVRTRLRLNFIKGYENYYDYYHSNSIYVIGENLRSFDYRFREGNLVLSLRNANTIVILDQDTFEIVWSYNGVLDSQHRPVMLKNGNILVFNNNYFGNQSEVLEIDPLTKEVVWNYTESNFYSNIRGHLQELDNGNVLVTESMKNRIFEINKDKEIIFDLKLNSKNNNKIYRAEIYPRNYVGDLIE